MNIINAEKRTPQSKAKQLRKSGFTPCCIYGSHLDESIPIQIEKSETAKLLRRKSEGGRVEINLGGEKIMAIVEGISRNPVKDEILHIDFHATLADKKVTTKSNIIIIGKEKVTGFIEQLLFEIPYVALPAHIVETVVIDVTGMKGGERMSLSDLDIAKNENIELLLDAETLVFNVRESRSGSAIREDEEAAAAAEAEAEA